MNDPTILHGASGASDFLNRDWIRQHVPHQGAMCLLDRVVEWNDRVVVCESFSHRSDANPLRANGGLSAIAAIEYAAQSMAVHGALLATPAARVGFLVSVRQVHVRRQRIDDLNAPLRIACSLETHADDAMMYAFEVTAGELQILDGKAAVILRVNNSHHAASRSFD